MGFSHNDPTRVTGASYQVVLRGLFFCSLAGLLAGCTISPYDQKTDDSLTQIQKDVDEYLANLKSGTPATRPAAATQPVKPPFYAKIDGEFNSLLIRTQARTGADPSVIKEYQSIRQFQQAVDGIWNIEAVSPGGVPGGLVDITQTSLDSAAKAALALELKRKTQ